MQKLSLSKQLAVVRLYLGGFSYDEIATRAGVGKGTVANVVGDLKAGRILDAQEPVEQLELLRDIAIDLRRLKLTPGQAVVGVAVICHLQELAVEPGEIERFVAVCRRLAGEETQAQVLVRAALYLKQVEERTGLSTEALEDKVHTLEEEVSRLEPLLQELKGSKHELKNLQKQRRSLADEMGQLEKRYRPLSQSVAEKEQREAELSKRVQDLELRAQVADERLGLARSELQTLTALGLSVDDLPGLVQRLGGVAQRHGIEPGALRDRLLHELEELDAGMGLESVVKLRQRELSEIEQTIAKAQRERVALDSALQQLRQQQASLHEAISEEETRVRKEMGAIARIAKETVAKLQQDLGDAMAQALVEVHKLTSEALKLGQEIGHYDAMVEANQWLETLVALAKGDGASSAKDVRTVGLTVLRGLNGWAHQNESQVSLPSGLTMRLNSTIEDLERWKP